MRLFARIHGAPQSANSRLRRGSVLSRLAAHGPPQALAQAPRAFGAECDPHQTSKLWMAWVSTQSHECSGEIVSMTPSRMPILRFSNGPGGVKPLPVRQGAVQHVSTIICDLPPILLGVNWECGSSQYGLAAELLASLRGQPPCGGRRHDAIRRELVSPSVPRGSPERRPTAQLTSSPDPPSRRRNSGEQGKHFRPCSVTLSSFVIEACRGVP